MQYPLLTSTALSPCGEVRGRNQSYQIHWSGWDGTGTSAPLSLASLVWRRLTKLSPSPRGGTQGAATCGRGAQGEPPPCSRSAQSINQRPAICSRCTAATACSSTPCRCASWAWVGSARGGLRLPRGQQGDRAEGSYPALLLGRAVRPAAVRL